MLYRFLILFVFGAFSILPPKQVIAADYINVNGWYKVVYAKFKPLCARRSLQILNEHFEKVDQTIGRNVIPFTFQTGEWDHVAYIPIQMSADGYDTIPPESEWRAALYEQEGSKENVGALFSEILGCIAHTKTEIARLSLGVPK